MTLRDLTVFIAGAVLALLFTRAPTVADHGIAPGYQIASADGGRVWVLDPLSGRVQLCAVIPKAVASPDPASYLPATIACTGQSPQFVELNTLRAPR